jgi:hypothetical protein
MSDGLRLKRLTSSGDGSGDGKELICCEEPPELKELLDDDRRFMRWVLPRLMKWLPKKP